MCVWREERGLCGLFLLGTLKGLDKQSVRGEDCGEILWKLCRGERWHSTAFWFPKRWEYAAKKLMVLPGPQPTLLWETVCFC